MSRLRRLPLPFEEFDEDFDDDNCSNSSKSGQPPIQRNAANARERARMRVLSSAFGRLKTKLPNIPPDTKLSKLDTLRLATIYIKQLKMLAESDPEKQRNENIEVTLQQTIGSNLSTPNCATNLTWPFAFQHIHTTNRQLAVSSQLATNWHPPEDFTDKLKTNENTYTSCNQEASSTVNAYQNKTQMCSNSPDMNNCLFDCIQQQQQLNYYMNRNHHQYSLPECQDHSNQNTDNQ